MAKKHKYIVRVTVVTEVKMTKGKVREIVQDSLDSVLHRTPMTLKVSTVDIQ